MEYLTREELVRLFKVARDHNKLHHVAMLVGLLHGLRVSAMLAIREGKRDPAFKNPPTTSRQPGNLAELVLTWPTWRKPIPNALGLPRKASTPAAPPWLTNTALARLTIIWR